MIERLHPKTNEEASQSLARIIISFVVAAVLFVEVIRHAELTSALVLVTAYCAASIPWFFWVKRTPNRFQSRRYFTITSDLMLTTLGLHLAGDQAPYFFSVYLWIIVGNGLRFGPRFLFLGCVIGFSGYSTLLAFNPIWQNNHNIGLSFFAGVVILPLFYFKVLRRSLDLNIQLEEELEKSKAAEKAKGDFLANMSHEIRTPMNGIIGMVEVLGDTELNTEQQNNLDIIRRSSSSLLNILNDILDYSKIASGKMTIEAIPMDLRDIFFDVVRLLQATADDKNITLEFDFPENQAHSFTGDPTRIRQIIFNLVGNAIKFTDQGTVTLRCRTIDDYVRHNVIIEVIDSGIGISEDRLEAIFDQFEQAEQGTTRQFGGTGLGLAISRQLSMLMGGEITVRSTQGRGTIFSVNLTLPISTEIVAVKAHNPGLPNFALKALVAEDNRVNQVVVRKLLKKIGIEIVDMANNGQEAVQMLSSEKHDVVFMDIRMPLMNGIDATRAIRALADDRKTIPIIALTADATSGDAARCMDAGMDGHLRKPLKVNELVSILNQLKQNFQKPVTL